MASYSFAPGPPSFAQVGQGLEEKVKYFEGKGRRLEKDIELMRTKCVEKEQLVAMKVRNTQRQRTLQEWRNTSATPTPTPTSFLLPTHRYVY
jgi:hypothetical protein